MDRWLDGRVIPQVEVLWLGDGLIGSSEARRRLDCGGLCGRGWGLDGSERWSCRREPSPQIPGRGFGARATPYAVTALAQITPPVRPTCSPGYQGPQPPPHGFTISSPPAHLSRPGGCRPGPPPSARRPAPHSHPRASLLSDMVSRAFYLSSFYMKTSFM